MAECTGAARGSVELVEKQECDDDLVLLLTAVAVISALQSVILARKNEVGCQREEDGTRRELEARLSKVP